MEAAAVYGGVYSQRKTDFVEKEKTEDTFLRVFLPQSDVEEDLLALFVHIEELSNFEVNDGLLSVAVIPYVYFQLRPLVVRVEVRFVITHSGLLANDLLYLVDQ